jgi:LDH2 family malate/lactate/ureidoglycolate dehydrogenase
VTERSLSISPAELVAWTNSILRQAGASPEAAGAAAASLVDADTRGVESHGVAQLQFYLPRLRTGAIRGDAQPEILVDLPAAALVDGHNAIGAYVGSIAMDFCCEKALRSGVGAVAVRRSNHFGAASWYSERAAERGCIGIALSNSDPGMAPTGALGPILGTNPLAIAAPGAAGMHRPSLDMATSVAAQTRVILAARAGRRIPAGWAIGPDGAPTDDPEQALRGAMLPLAGHKGFALAFMVDVLTGCLAGARISPEIERDPRTPRPQGTGHLFLAIHLDSLCEPHEYAAALQRLTDAVHDAPRTAEADPFLIPGEPEARVAAERFTAIPLTPETVSLLQELGDEFGVAFPLEEVRAP